MVTNLREPRVKYYLEQSELQKHNKVHTRRVTTQVHINLQMKLQKYKRLAVPRGYRCKWHRQRLQQAEKLENDSFNNKHHETEA
jgi:hypothetical protein